MFQLNIYLFTKYVSILAIKGKNNCYEGLYVIAEYVIAELFWNSHGFDFIFILFSYEFIGIIYLL